MKAIVARIFMALSQIFVTACESGTPEIARGLPSTYTDAEPIFDARLKARFPPGTTEHKLLDELGQQGFPMPPSRWRDGIASTTFTRNELISKTIWSVRWRARDARITEIWGVHGAIAP